MKSYSYWITIFLRKIEKSLLLSSRRIREKNYIPSKVFSHSAAVQIWMIFLNLTKLFIQVTPHDSWNHQPNIKWLSIFYRRYTYNFTKKICATLILWLLSPFMIIWPLNTVNNIMSQIPNNFNNLKFRETSHCFRAIVLWLICGMELCEITFHKVVGILSFQKILVCYIFWRKGICL